MSLAGLAGVPSSAFAKYPPRHKPINILGNNLNNINISNSVVGTVNTGFIDSINQSISTLNQLGEESISESIKKLTDSVISSKELNKSQINELVEILSTVSIEAATPSNNRKNTIAKTLLSRGSEIITLANDIADVYQKYWPILNSVFN